MTAHRTQPWVDREAAALAAASRGWRVFPLQVGGLLPAVRDWHDRATDDSARIARCWAAGAFNIGLAPCLSRLLVFDLAPAEPGETPPGQWLPGVVDGADVLALLAERHGAALPTETYTVRTPHGGIHLYFSHPHGPCPPTTYGPTSPLGWHIGLRTRGAYVPAVGTTTAAGAFTVIHDTDPAPLPDWLAALLPSHATPAPSRGAA